MTLSTMMPWRVTPWWDERPTTTGGRCPVSRRRWLGGAIGAVVLGRASIRRSRAEDGDTGRGKNAGERRSPAVADARAVAVSPDGRLVAAAWLDVQPDVAWSDSGRIAVWDVATGRLVRMVETRGDVLNLRLSEAGGELTYGISRTVGDAVDDDAVFLLSVAGTGAPLRFPGSGVFALAPRGDRLVFADPEVLFVRRMLPRGDRPERIAAPDGGSGAECLAFSPDGAAVAAVYRTREPVAGSGGRITRRPLHGLALIAADTMRPTATAVTDAVTDCSSLDVSAGGTLVASGHDDGTVRLWSGADLTAAGVVAGSGRAAACVAFSPDAAGLAVLTQPAEPRRKGRPTATRCRLSVHRVPGLEVLRQYEFENGGVVTSHARRERLALNPRRLAWLPGGDAVLVGVSGASIIDVANGTVRRNFMAEEAAPAGGSR